MSSEPKELSGDPAKLLEHDEHCVEPVVRFVKDVQAVAFDKGINPDMLVSWCVAKILSGMHARFEMPELLDNVFHMVNAHQAMRGSPFATSLHTSDIGEGPES